jgi:hypothetical protein
MTATVKNKIGLTVPPAVQHQLPTAGDEYTPSSAAASTPNLTKPKKDLFMVPSTPLRK